MPTLARPRPLAPARAGAGPVRVLHLVGRMTCGGVQMRTLELYRRLDRGRFRFDFCALSGLAAELDEHVRALGGRMHLLRAGRRDFVERFQEVLRRGRYDVVHSHVHYRSGYPLRLADRCGVPVRVAHFRNSHQQRCERPLRGLARTLLAPFVERYASNHVARQWIDRHATDILGVSYGALDAAWGPPWRLDRRCRVVYDGLDPADFALKRDAVGVRREFSLGAAAPLLIHVGRMTPQKNHPRLVSIFAELARRLPRARLLLVGREDEAISGRVRRAVAGRGIADRVVFAGERLDVPRLVKAADVLLFPSTSEGLGDVVLEACAAGTPALCSDLPSIREIAGHLPGIERLSLAEPDARWADRLAAVAANPPDEAMREAALARFSASVFHVDRSAAALCAIWQRADSPLSPVSCPQAKGVAVG